jgi:hypothetical protein
LYENRPRDDEDDDEDDDDAEVDADGADTDRSRDDDAGAVAALSADDPNTDDEALEARLAQQAAFKAAEHARRQRAAAARREATKVLSRRSFELRDLRRSLALSMFIRIALICGQRVYIFIVSSRRILTVSQH